MITNKEQCSKVTSFRYPCLSLDNTDETAEKLQNTVMMFCELYPCEGNESFETEGSMFLNQVMAGNVSDRWPKETGYFCYDTAIEKYKAFLAELEKGQT